MGIESVSPNGKKNVILIVIDTLRTDRLGCYGNSRNLTPAIDEIAAEGIVFDNCFSTFNATDPSFTTILTGLFPANHGIINHGDLVLPGMIKQFNENHVELIPEMFQKNGYNTIGLDWLGRWHKKGFSYYLGMDSSESIPKAEFLTDVAISQINSSDVPFFLFIHFWDVHTPYQPPVEMYNKFKQFGGIHKIPDIFEKIKSQYWKEYLITSAGEATTAEEVIAAYDACVHYVDYEIGRLIKFLKEKSIFENTIFVITSDHGESLLEHEILFNHHGLYDESIHVPLILGNLPYPRQRINDLIQHTEIAPTLFELSAIPYNNDFVDGNSLLPAIRDKKPVSRPFIIIEETYLEKKIALRTVNWKYIMARTPEDAICRYCGYTHGGVEELYDLISDPNENTNCIGDYPEIAKGFRDTIVDWENVMKKKQMERTIKQKILRVRTKFFCNKL